ncbi:MAG: NERD domain-containing protein [Deltaproteobacteria bacterium]|nr:NERD domain-containing protein [Deltaproteobacteria bacterium]
MLLKSASDKSAAATQLECLIALAPTLIKPKIETELRILRAGCKGESESAYHIDFFFKKSENWIVIHDLRFEKAGRTAQIDHLLINRYLDCYVMESKHFHAGLKISEELEFNRWNAFKKTYEGMASPLAQNHRHIEVLKDVFADLELPLRNGVRIEPVFHSVVLVSPDARVDRPKVRDTSSVLKADLLYDYIIKNHRDEEGPHIGNPLVKPIYRDSLEDIGQCLIALDRPLSVNYEAKFGVSQSKQPDPAEILFQVDETDNKAVPEAALTADVADFSWKTSAPGCRDCQSTDVSVHYGKYGYYFKCAACQTATAIRPVCGHDHHKPRLRKDGLNYYQECADCKVSTLYFTNPS